ncbi:MAG: hypothetical protein MRY74_16080 [Neomegalonema sp.]|nr:hypothetical protein [Neomegalonema sp.]
MIRIGAVLALCAVLAGCGAQFAEPEQTVEKKRGAVAAALISYCVREGARRGDFRSVDFKRFSFRRLPARGDGALNYGLLGSTGEALVVSLKEKSCLIGSSARGADWISERAALAIADYAEVGRKALDSASFAIIVKLKEGGAEFVIHVSGAPAEPAAPAGRSPKTDKKDGKSGGIATYALIRRVAAEPASK